MPRLIHGLFCLILLLALAACGVQDSDATRAETSTAPQSLTETTEIPVIPTRRSTSSPAPAPSASSLSAIPSIYDETIPVTRAERITISEINLMLEAGQLLMETNWDGDKDTPLPLRPENFNQGNLQAYIEDEQADEQDFTIPAELESLYIGAEATTEIESLLLTAHGEYLAYLEAQGVLPLYLEEVRRVLPATLERITYHPENDPTAPPTAVESLQISDERKDHSQAVMNLYPVDIFNGAGGLEEARLLGEPPTGANEYRTYHRQLRDMALRQLFWHEMTHVLQRAYVNLHVEDPAERTRKSSYLFATHTLFKDVDTQYHWKWGNGFFADSNNKQVSDESQADGIAYEMLTTLYDMSDVQKAAVWDHQFGRLDKARQNLNEIRLLFEQNYPDFTPEEFGDLLAEVMSNYPQNEGRRQLTTIAFRLAAIPAYIGYLNPMEPDDTPKFWEALRQE